MEINSERLNPPPKPKDNWRNLIERMTQISTAAYRKNINENSDFIRYFKRAAFNLC